MAYLGFDKLKNELADKPGVKNPAALATYIGEKKYGKKAFQKGAQNGTSLKSVDAINKSAQ